MAYNWGRVFLLLITPLLLVPIAYSQDYTPLQEDIKTLTQWSNRCFKELIEHSSGNKNIEGTFLNGQEFENCLKLFIEESRTLLMSPDAWLHGSTSAPEHLFQIDQDMQLEYKVYKYSQKYLAYHPFVQKLVVPSNSEVCFIGDLHGSVHSLLRDLWRLVALGWLGDDFKLTKPNLYIIFNGDFVDRGAYGVECIYTLLRLKLANWNNLFLLRGNHENVETSTDYGFKAEVERKYSVQADNYWKKLISRFYELLPFVLYLGSGKDPENGGKPNFVQCCHGGVETGYDPAKLLNDKTGKKFERIPDNVTVGFCNGEVEKTDNYSGFNWSDFIQNNNKKITFNHLRGAGYKADVDAAQEFLDKNNLKGFFRGHQDRCFGLKMFFKSKKDCDNFIYLKLLTYARKIKKFKKLDTEVKIQLDMLQKEISKWEKVLNENKKSLEAAFQLGMHQNLKDNLTLTKDKIDDFFNWLQVGLFFSDEEMEELGIYIQKIIDGELIVTHKLVDITMKLKTLSGYSFEEMAKNLGFFDWGDYQYGPYYWPYIVTDKEEKKRMHVGLYAPIFTFTTAAEGQAVSYDCFGILQTSDLYKDWILTPYEYRLNGYPDSEKRRNRQGKNHPHIFFENNEVVTYFFNPDNLYGPEKESASSLAGVAKQLSDLAIQNQIKRLQSEILVVKLEQLKDSLVVLKQKLFDLSKVLGTLRGAFQAE